MLGIQRDQLMNLYPSGSDWIDFNIPSSLRICSMLARFSGNEELSNSLAMSSDASAIPFLVQSTDKTLRSVGGVIEATWNCDGYAAIANRTWSASREVAGFGENLAGSVAFVRNFDSSLPDLSQFGAACSIYGNTHDVIGAIRGIYNPGQVTTRLLDVELRDKEILRNKYSLGKNLLELFNAIIAFVGIVLSTPVVFTIAVAQLFCSIQAFLIKSEMQQMPSDAMFQGTIQIN